VLALGGGAASHPGTRSLLTAVPVVYLRVGYAEAFARVGGDKGRPMLARADVFDVYTQRLAVYDSVATLAIDTDRRRPEDVAADILAGLEHG
jgi:shikimate kinase